MINLDKVEIRKTATVEQIFNLLEDWGGEPKLTDFGIVSATICHNEPGEGSHKLYYYDNSKFFKCYTGCANDIFDIFELAIKVMQIQYNIEWDLNEAVRFIASKINFQGTEILSDDFGLIDWEKFTNYSRLQEISINDYKAALPVYDDSVLSKFNYTLKIRPWLQDNINQNVIEFAKIGFYPGGDQITIPHYNIDNELVGVRGRTLCKAEGERYGKYRPIKINNIQYSHSLGLNLYGLNWAKNNIKIIKKAIVFESEKSVLQYMSYFGIENNIAVACCGSSISMFQIKQLLDCQVEEIIIAFDRQFQEIRDKEYFKLIKNLERINSKYSKYVLLSFIFDNKMITEYKDSPTDKGKDVFLKLYKERIFL